MFCVRTMTKIMIIHFQVLIVRCKILDRSRKLWRSFWSSKFWFLKMCFPNVCIGFKWHIVVDIYMESQNLICMVTLTQGFYLITGLVKSRKSLLICLTEWVNFRIAYFSLHSAFDFPCEELFIPINFRGDSQQYWRTERLNHFPSPLITSLTNHKWNRMKFPSFCGA